MAAQIRGIAPAAKAAGAPKQRGVVTKPKRSAKAAGIPLVRISVSYSHMDAVARKNLHTHLAPWRRDGVAVWYDENIEPGAELTAEIARELRRARILVAPFRLRTRGA